MTQTSWRNGTGSGHGIHQGVLALLIVSEPGSLCVSSDNAFRCIELQQQRRSTIADANFWSSSNLSKCFRMI